MGNFGPLEILVVAVFALLVFGPRKLPGIMRSVGRAVGEFKRAANEFSEELKSGLDETPAQPEPPDPRPGPKP